jgi:tRNA threonylcarbamoyl adenosine modification protein YeaZ/ribosomal-protein-alanine acetyltransferase
MTISLVIDTSTSRTSVAIVSAGETVASFRHDDALAHGEVLPRLVSQALTQLPTDLHLDQVIVGMGPGPFTGLRVGIAFAQSFAFARQIPLIGLCSLDFIVDSTAPSDYLVATDARRKEVFWARFSNGVRIGEPQVSAPQTLKLLDLPSFGEGSSKYDFSSNEVVNYPDPLLMARGFSTASRYTAPIYVRRPDAFPAPVNVSFRPMNQLDLVNIFDLEKRSYAYDAWSLGQLKEEYAAKNRWYLVAEKEGKVVGYVGGLLVGNVTDVLTLTVDPNQRRNGIGRELLRRLIDWSRTQKAAALMLEMRVDNAEAEPLYLAFGFVEISRRPDYYGPGITAIVMRKDLT